MRKNLSWNLTDWCGPHCWYSKFEAHVAARPNKLTLQPSVAFVSSAFQRRRFALPTFSIIGGFSF